MGCNLVARPCRPNRIADPLRSAPCRYPSENSRGKKRPQAPLPYEEVTISSEIDGRVEEVGPTWAITSPPDRSWSGFGEEQRYLLAQNEAQLRQSLGRLGLKSETDRVKDLKETPEVRRAQADLNDAEQRFKRVEAWSSKVSARARTWTKRRHATIRSRPVTIRF